MTNTIQQSLIGRFGLPEPQHVKGQAMYRRVVSRATRVSIAELLLTEMTESQARDVFSSLLLAWPQKARQ